MAWGKRSVSQPRPALPKSSKEMIQEAEDAAHSGPSALAIERRGIAVSVTTCRTAPLHPLDTWVSVWEIWCFAPHLWGRESEQLGGVNRTGQAGGGGRHQCMGEARPWGFLFKSFQSRQFEVNSIKSKNTICVIWSSNFVEKSSYLRVEKLGY